MNVFTYGTLMFPEVMQLLIGYQPASEESVVSGYERKALKGEVYPGIIENKDSKLEGRIWFDLKPQDLEILDKFEGDFYLHEEIEVSSLSKRIVRARIYTVKNEYRQMLSDDSWDAKAFIAEHLNDYLLSCREWMELVADQLKGVKRLN